MVVLRGGTVSRAPSADGAFSGLSVGLVTGNPEGTWRSVAESEHHRVRFLPFRGDTLADSVVFTLPAVELSTLTGYWIVVHEWRVRDTGATRFLLSDRQIPTAWTIFDANPAQ